MGFFKDLITNPETSDQAIEDQSELLALMDKRYDRGVKAFKDAYLEAEEAFRMFRGDQWLKKSKDNGWLSSKPEASWKVRLVINKLLPRVESSISTYISQKPIIQCDPATNEDIDVKSAKISSKVLKYYWKKLDFDTLLIDLWTWICVPGNCFLECLWDETAGEDIPQYEMSEQNEEGVENSLPIEPQLTGSIKSGDLHINIIPLFSMIIDPGASSLEKARWCMVTEIVSKDILEERYNIDLANTNDSKRLESNRMFDPRLINGKEINTDEYCVLFRMYERPTSKFPNGRLIYRAGDQILLNTELPEGKIKIVHFQDIKLPGTLLGTSRVSQAISSQVELNKNRSQMIEDLRLMGRPKWIAPVGSIAQQTINKDPGQVIFTDITASRGMEPKPINGIQINQSRFTLLHLIDEDISDLMSRHNVSLGGTMPGVNSNVQAQSFMGADNSRDMVRIVLFEKQLAKFFEYMLETLSENMTDERIASVTGENGRKDIFSFTKNDVSNVANVTVSMTSQIQWDRQALRQQLVWMASQGWISKEELLKRLDIPISQDFYETEQIHRTNARKENELLLQYTFPPSETDNHEIHIEEHKYEINLPEHREEMIQALISTGQFPPTMLNIKQHMEQHRQALPPPPAPVAQTKIQLSGELPPEQASALANSGTGSGNFGPEQKPEQGVATPPGGQSGEVYSRTELPEDNNGNPSNQ